MANYQDEMDREALLSQMGGEEEPLPNIAGPTAAAGAFGTPVGGGIQAPVDPQTTPIEGGPAAPAMESGKYRGQLAEAFNMDKMTAEHAAKSPKYAFAMLAQDYPDTPEGLQAMSQDPRFAAAGFKMLGKDKIYAPDPERGGAMGIVDVGNSFSVGGGKGWQWGAEPGSSGGPIEGDPGQSGMMDQGALMQGQDYGSEGFFQRLLQQLQQQAGPESTDREALLRMVGA